jgi:hypothetical protein
LQTFGPPLDDLIERKFSGFSTLVGTIEDFAVLGLSFVVNFDCAERIGSGTTFAGAEKFVL